MIYEVLERELERSYIFVHLFKLKLMLLENSNKTFFIFVDHHLFKNKRNLNYMNI